MAEPVSLASGILTLVTFAHKSCLTLHTTIQSFKDCPKQVRDLIKELEALISVLESLSDTIKLHTDINPPALDLPLWRCGNACDEFLQELQKYRSRSGGDRNSFRDWSKIRYMGDNIDAFRHSVAAYKSTINIALTDLQLRRSSITLGRLKEFEQLIKTATIDLEAQLETIDAKLQTLANRTTSSSAKSKLQSIADERSSIQKSLMICAHSSNFVYESQFPFVDDFSTGSDDTLEKITGNTLEEYRTSTNRRAVGSENHMQASPDRKFITVRATMPQLETAIGSVESLHNTVARFKGRNKALQRLQGELQGLISVLNSLKEVAHTEASVSSLLQGPIDQCSEVCQEFEQSMQMFSQRTKASFRDWAKIEFMSGDINEFIDTISGYKSTIAVGLGTITIRTANVSQKALDEYNEMIQDTVYDLNVRLQRVDQRLEAYSNPESTTPSDSIIDKKGPEKPSVQELKDQVNSFFSIERDATVLGKPQVTTQVEKPSRPETLLPGGLVWFTEEASAENNIDELPSSSKSPEPKANPLEKKEVLRLRDDFDASKQGLDFCKLKSERLPKNPSGSTGSTDDNADSKTGIVGMEDEQHINVTPPVSARFLSESSLDASPEHMIDQTATPGKTAHLEIQYQASEPESLDVPRAHLPDSVPDASTLVWNESEPSLDGSTVLEQQTRWDGFKRLEISQREGEDVDYLSVTSNNEDIASQAPRFRSQPELLALKLFALCFAKLDDLSELHQELLRKLGEQGFVENYRRSLKIYVLKLREEARTSLEKDTVKILENRENRRSIASAILAHMKPEIDEARGTSDSLAFEPLSDQALEAWSQDVYGKPEITSVLADSSGEESENEDRGDSEKSYLKTLTPTNVEIACTFLQKSVPLQVLSLQLRLLSLPPALREILDTTPRDDICVSSQDNQSFLNRYKRFVETHTAFEWDWWPLQSFVPDLTPDQSRLEWKFCGNKMYTLISHRQATTIKQVLAAMSEHPSNCHCCQPRPDRLTWSTACWSVYSAMYESLPIAGRVLPSPALPLPARLQRQESPRMFTSTNPLFLPPKPQMLSSLGDYRSNTEVGFRALANNENHHAPVDSLWVIFGIENLRGFHNIEHIEVQTKFSDPSFFQELKTRHENHRRWFSRWLSPYRFQYCRFVQFDEILEGHVSCLGEALPDDHGFADDYDYNPRPPAIRNPPINVACFSTLLRACNPNCRWSLLPVWLHTCRRIPTGCQYLIRIPRKKGTYNAPSFVQRHQSSIPSRVAFGIDAAYRMSSLGLLTYHVIFILLGFIFWIYWLKNHPSDLQNASVPLFTIVMLLGTFWGLYGRKVGTLNDS